MTAKHTLGPLVIKDQGEANTQALLKNGEWLAIIQQNGSLMSETQNANMRLWANAAELLDACIEAQRVLADYDDGFGDENTVYVMLCAAIAKATGGKHEKAETKTG